MDGDTNQEKNVTLWTAVKKVAKAVDGFINIFITLLLISNTIISIIYYHILQYNAHLLLLKISLIHISQIYWILFLKVVK